MNANRRLRYQRLLRWYPMSWRQTNETVMIDTLEQHADAHGRARPTVGEAWSIRAHGLARRVTPRVILGVAGVALLLHLAYMASYILGESPWPIAWSVAIQFLAALLVSISAGALLVRAGTIRPETGLVACALAVPSWLLGALTMASWSIGVDEADAGAAQSWFGGATGIFLLGAWMLGSIALTPVACAIFTAASSRLLLIVSTILSFACALALGIAAFTPGGISLGAVGVVVAAGFQLREPGERLGEKHRILSQLTLRKRRNAAAIAAAVAAVLGLGCSVFALTGSVWLPAVGDATQAMRTGVLVGALVATLTVVAGAAALFPRMGRAVFAPAAALVASLLVFASSYALDVWSLHLIAAALFGLAGGGC